MSKAKAVPVAVKATVVDASWTPGGKFVPLTKVNNKINAGKLAALIDNAIRHSVKGNELYHTAAVQAMYHASAHDDPVYCDRLVKGLGKSSRVQSLVYWFEEFSPVRWNGDGKCGILPKTAKKFVDFNLEAANETPFYELVEETKPSRLTLAKMLQSVIALQKRLDKAVEEDRFDGDVTEAKAVVVSLKDFAEAKAKEAKAA